MYLGVFFSQIDFKLSEIPAYVLSVFKVPTCYT